MIGHKAKSTRYVADIVAFFAAVKWPIRFEQDTLSATAACSEYDKKQFNLFKNNKTYNKQVPNKYFN